MANHGVVVVNKLLAKDNDSLVRPVKTEQNLDNGSIMSASYAAATSGSLAEVFMCGVPTTGSLTGLWMMYEPEIPFVTNSAGTNVFNGLGTIQDFYVASSAVATAVKLSPEDIITITSDLLDSTTPAAYAIASNGKYTWTWAATSSGCVTTLQYLNTTYIPSADGTIGSGRITAYRFRVMNN
jgi:hypothetical protein